MVDFRGLSRRVSLGYEMMMIIFFGRVASLECVNVRVSVCLTVFARYSVWAPVCTLEYYIPMQFAMTDSLLAKCMRSEIRYFRRTFFFVRLSTPTRTQRQNHSQRGSVALPRTPYEQLKTNKRSLYK